MMKDIAWHFFKKTGNISTFLEYKSLTEQSNKEVINEKMGDVFGDSQDKGNSNKSGQF